MRNVRDSMPIYRTREGGGLAPSFHVRRRVDIDEVMAGLERSRSSTSTTR